MTIDSELDLEGLKRIGKIVAQTLQEMINHVRPGITTAELDEVGARLLKKNGARSAPMLVYNFPGATCISINDEAAHGIPGERTIRPGDLVNIDVSAELEGYFADTAATISVPPTSRLHQKLLSCTQNALQRAIHSARAGQPMNVIGKKIEAEARHCGFQILRELNGHGVGRNIHEEPQNVSNYFNPFDRRPLSDGLVITIEPFLSTGTSRVKTGKDGWTLSTIDGSLCAQFEHTLVIRRGRPIIITTP